MLQSMSFPQAAAGNADFTGILLLFVLVVAVWGVYFFRRGRMKK